MGNIIAYSEKEQIIINCFENDVRSYIQSHGGDIEFVSYKETIIFVRLKGACSGCPLSFYTLKMGVLEAVKKQLPEVTDIQIAE